MAMYAGDGYNYDLAFKQYLQLYKFFTDAGSLVYLLPSVDGLQDQTYVANLGCYLPHTERTVAVANFKSEPRIGEAIIGKMFFAGMGYDIIQPPTHWEGEAELKWLCSNIYFGGYGIRSELQSYHWLMDRTEAQIYPIEMDDEKLYHFDCVFCPLTSNKALVATKAIKKADMRIIERFVEVIDIPQEQLYNAWTNCVVHGNKVLFTPGTTESGPAFCEYISKHGFEPVIINLTEFEKSGAALSCMVLHLNYKAMPPWSTIYEGKR